MTSLSVVHVDSSPVGTGKTHRAIERAVAMSSKWLFAVQRIDGIREIEARIRKMISADTRPAVVAIMSDGNIRGQSVRQELEALPSKYEQGHVIAICTHNALMMSDLSGFDGWNLVVDEVPEVLQSGEPATKLDVAFFEQNYFLTAATRKWSAVSPTEAGARISGSALQQDDSHRHLRVFHQRVLASVFGGRHVVCNLQDWSQMTGSDVRWVWWSLFSLDELSTFKSVTFLGNGFMQSVSAKMLRQRSPQFEWRENHFAGLRVPQPRRVRISYFSNQRRASKSFFESPRGQDQLSRIAEFLAKNVNPLIWSCNKSVRAVLQNHFPPHSWITPKQAGTNRFMGISRSAMIYAAKPSPEMRKIIEAVGVTNDDWIETNEWETILQFVTRTSIREPASANDVTVHVFDHEQAAYLKRFFDRQPHIEASTEWIDLGLDLSPGKSGRPTRAISPQESERRLETRRKQKCEWARQDRLKRKMILAGNVRGGP